MQAVPPSKSADAIAADVARIIAERVARANAKSAPAYAPLAPRVAATRVFA